MKAIVSCTLLAAALAAVPLMAADFAGTFLNDEEGLEVSLQVGADGALTGRMSADGQWVTLKGRVQGDAFAAVMAMEGMQVPVYGRLQNDHLVLAVGTVDDPDESWVLRRAETGVAATAAPGSNPMPPAPSAPGSRKVVINGTTLPLETLNALEQQYRIRIEDADYWYDPKCGAWGLRGGPTLGFIPAGLKLGGPLPADASGKGTGVFLNGREAHAQDVLALQSILGPVMPGRYFIDAQGNAGYEGGMPLVNLVVAARQTAQQRGGGGNWSSRLLDAGGAWDGNGSGYVMGRDASGKSWSASY